VRGFGTSNSVVTADVWRCTDLYYIISLHNDTCKNAKLENYIDWKGHVDAAILVTANLIFFSIISNINVKNCSLSTTYNGEMTHRKQQK